ncbi:histidine kinase [Mucilaginibacter sp. PPCGB 2223]|uniref:tetratricopeptide repeat-containing sensor histidine kinase n=1 Tax=Mucilaginibacter sp. PPCGB 2223 TaxID=1886027 RepID=UPI0008260BD8|nr:tetratricopeptide repeat-containing sensor histidine kinase [Mucilaginibacter sp. PPCGB 2223]OCX54266.1 histidine kinase [Mucilaginibacter sp. PPCGB 2223]
MKKLGFLLPVLLTTLYACRQEKQKDVVADNRYYQKAEAFWDHQNDSAFYYYNKAATTSKDSVQVAMAYNNMALLQSNAGDYFGGQESLSLSLKFLREDDPKDHACLASDYNDLGTNSLKLKNYDEAIAFYDRGMRFTANKEFLAMLYNNQGNAYQKKKAYNKALERYRTALTQTKAGGRTYARILTNMASTRWLQRPGFNAAPDLMRALRIRLKEGDRWGQNSSYIHLANYYTKSHPDSALIYAGKMYAVATALNSPDDRLEALQKLIALAPDPAAKTYFSTYQQLNDSVQTARNAAKNQFALIRYDTEKAKTDNLRLQKENADKKYELIKKNAQLYGIIGLFVLAIVAVVLWYRKRKRKQAEETQEAVRETQRRASKKVHDTLANDIYRIMKKVQYGTGLGQEELLDDIDDVYKRARDISYELVPGADEDFQEKISALVLAFGTEETKVLLVGNSAEFWQKIEPAYKFELKYILQELMVNMQKHSGAGNVVVKFETDGERCVITYMDDGIGMPEETVYKNGLTNTGNRIKAMQGELIFDHSHQGLTIQLCFKARLS